MERLLELAVSSGIAFTAKEEWRESNPKHTRIHRPIPKGLGDEDSSLFSSD
jgi:hypothetical protein